MLDYKFVDNDKTFLSSYLYFIIMTTHPLTVTLDLLDALLSPTDCASAELMYYSIPLISRASSILSILISFPPHCNTNTGRIMLASVLLRRDIATIEKMKCYYKWSELK